MAMASGYRGSRRGQTPLASIAMTDESLEDFKNSFSYGTRTDLSFKFLKKLSAADAGEFLRQLLEEVGASLDHGDITRLHDLVYEWQVRGYMPARDAPTQWSYEDGPLTNLGKPLADCTVGLLTSSGHFHAADEPAPFGVVGMTQAEAIERIGEFLREPPELSVIPSDTAARELRVRHGGYDIRGAEADFNVALPRDALTALAKAGRIGGVADEMYSFVGATSQGRLRRDALPGWIERLQQNAIDVLLLVPV